MSSSARTPSPSTSDAREARPAKPFPTSEWMGVCCQSERDYSAIRSWFGPMAPESWGNPVGAEVLTRTADDRELKVRAVFRTANGHLMEAIRTLGGSNYSIRRGPATLSALKRLGISGPTQKGGGDAPRAESNLTQDGGR